MSETSFEAQDVEVDEVDVGVIDTSILIQFKRKVPGDAQWSLLSRMNNLVDQGRLAFPRQVKHEMKAGRHPDAPGAWAMYVAGRVRHLDPHEESIAEVLSAAQLIDPNGDDDREVADPYVVAMAWELQEEKGLAVVVVTEDRVDRMPAKESVVTACNRLAIAHWSNQRFVQWVISSLG